MNENLFMKIWIRFKTSYPWYEREFQTRTELQVIDMCDHQAVENVKHKLIGEVRWTTDMVQTSLNEVFLSSAGAPDFADFSKHFWAFLWDIDPLDASQSVTRALA